MSIIAWQTTRLARPNDKVMLPIYWPPTRNQMYGAVIARYVREKKNCAVLTNPDQITGLLASPQCALLSPPHPDLIVAGPDVMCLPAINHGFHTPFQIEGKSHLSSKRVDGLAFGIGICSMLFALDMMRLSGMPWPQMIAESVGLSIVTEAQRGTVEVLLGFPCFILWNEGDKGAQTLSNNVKTYTNSNSKWWLADFEVT